MSESTTGRDKSIIDRLFLQQGEPMAKKLDGHRSEQLLGIVVEVSRPVLVTDNPTANLYGLLGMR